MNMYSGVVSTVAGGGGSTLPGNVDGVGAVSRFSGPYGISSLSTGDLVVADTHNHIIRKITSSGLYTPTHIRTTHAYTHSYLHSHAYTLSYAHTSTHPLVKWQQFFQFYLSSFFS